VTFSDLEVAVSQCRRQYGYVRDSILTIWTPGAGSVQHVYSRELAGAMLREADEFFDRALALYFLRRDLRELQASTWAGVATYYANYFLALSFTRLHMRSITQLPTGTVFEVARTDDQTPMFKIEERNQRQRHVDVWRRYYEIVSQMAWPDPATVTELAPTLASLRFREQVYRERINYRPGEGFEEIHMTATRYQRNLRAVLDDDGGSPTMLSDAAYTDRMAVQRLKHVAALLDRLSESRIDADIEAAAWNRRRDIVTRSARTRADERLGSSLVSGPR
jgi:hypothetical protein